MSPRKKNSKTLTLGIDLGGTKVAVGLVEGPSGRLLTEVIRPTVPPELAQLDPRSSRRPPTQAMVKRHIRYVVRAIAEAAVEALSDAEQAALISSRDRLCGVGLASAGPMNLERGTLDHPANFTGWKIVPLVDLVRKELGDVLPSKHLTLWKSRGIQFQNDAISAALGEGWCGKARSCETYVMITVGTGIGTGVILNGKPAQSRGMGAEWGHMIVDCHADDLTGDSGYCEVEGHASGTWLVHRARRLNLKATTAAELAALAKRGDRKAQAIWRDASRALASLLHNLSLGFHPEKFVFGGGLMALHEHFLPETERLYRNLLAKKNPAFLARLEISELGNRAGVIGAARLPHL